MNASASIRVGQQRGLVSRLRVMHTYRELMWMLAWRDIRVRYKHSLLGGAWAILPPVAMMLIFTFVFGTMNQIDPQKLTGHAAMPYWLFALGGLVPWTFFANGLAAATTSLVSNRQLVTKIYFPREVFPISAIGCAFVDFLIASAALVLLALGSRYITPGYEYRLTPMALLLPVVMAVQACLMVGLGLLLSVANLFYRDVGFVFRALIQLWMFLTCVVYQLNPVVPWKRALIQANPMTPIIQAYRDCLLSGHSPFTPGFLAAAGLSVSILLFGWIRFLNREGEFAEHI